MPFLPRRAAPTWRRERPDTSPDGDKLLDGQLDAATPGRFASEGQLQSAGEEIPGPRDTRPYWRYHGPLVSAPEPSAASALVVPATATLILTGLAPLILAPRLVVPGAASLTLTRFAPVVLTPRLVLPGVRALTLTTFAPTALAPRVAIPGTRALVLSGLAPAVVIGKLVLPGTRSLTLTAFAPTVLTPRVVIPAKLTLTLTTFAPTVKVGVFVVPGARALTLTTFAPTVLTPRLVLPGVRALTLTRFAPTVQASNHIRVTPGTRAVTLTGLVPVVVATNHVRVTPGTRALALTRFAPTVLGVVVVFTVGGWPTMRLETRPARPPATLRRQARAELPLAWRVRPRPRLRATTLAEIRRELSPVRPRAKAVLELSFAARGLELAELEVGFWSRTTARGEQGSSWSDRELMDQLTEAALDSDAGLLVLAGVRGGEN